MSRSVLRSLLAASMEELEEKEFIEVEKGDLTASNDLAIDEIEMVKDSSSVEGAADAVDELDEISAGLEALVAGIETGAPNGTLPRQAANYFMISDQYLSNRLGLESVSGISMEGVSDEVYVSTEGLKETLGKVWVARKEAFVRGIKAIRDFFAKMFMSLKKVQGWVERYRKELTAFDGRTPSGKIKVKGGENLNLRGVFDYATIREGLQQAVTLGRHFFGEYLDRSAEYYTMAASWLTDNDLKDIDKPDVDSMVEKFNSKLVDVYEITVRVNTIEMSGGYKFFGEYGQTDTGRQTRLFRYHMVRSPQASRAQSTTEIELPAVGDLQDILNDIEAIADMIMNKQASLDRFIDLEDKAITEALKVIGVGNSNTVGTQYDRAVLTQVLERYTVQLSYPIHQYGDVAFPALRSALDLVDRSISAYKKLPVDVVAGE